jgi:hypothetical protein
VEGTPLAIPRVGLHLLLALRNANAKEWSKRPVERLEQQIRLQTAQSMYPDATSMPAALRVEVRDITNADIDKEMTRLASGEAGPTVQAPMAPKATDA